MSGRFDRLTQDMMEQAKQNNVDMDTVSKVMENPETQNLLRAFSGSNGASIKKAALAAESGDSAAAAGLISSLLSTKEGKALAQQVMASVKKK